eukprot:scaffold161304_cov30-Prasinocladus_malaysianus.AAC.1
MSAVSVLVSLVGSMAYSYKYEFEYEDRLVQKALELAISTVGCLSFKPNFFPPKGRLPNTITKCSLPLLPSENGLVVGWQPYGRMTRLITDMLPYVPKTSHARYSAGGGMAAHGCHLSQLIALDADSKFCHDTGSPAFEADGFPRRGLAVQRRKR